MSCTVFREIVGKKVIKALKRKDDAISHACVDFLCALMQPMHDNFDIRQEQMKQTLSTLLHRLPRLTAATTQRACGRSRDFICVLYTTLTCIHVRIYNTSPCWFSLLFLAHTETGYRCPRHQCCAGLLHLCNLPSLQVSQSTPTQCHN